MAEHDTFTYHVKKSSNDQTHTTVHSLITQERTQKLELLIHLISNLTQTLVVCGPKGIGKTTLLKVLQEREVTSWFYCPIQGNAELSFEEIQANIARVVNQTESYKQDQSLTRIFGQLTSQNKKIVLIIDDAGDLVPGLITAITQYAAANPVLRVIFVLTHDELYVKNRSDQTIDDCHLIEIPPFSEKQCGEFLQHLSTQPGSHVSLNAINESTVENIYRETHGVPGRIISELAGLTDNKPGENSIRFLGTAVAVLVAITLGFQWFSSAKNPDKEKITPVAVDQKVLNVESAQPQLISPPALALINPGEQPVEITHETPLPERKPGNTDDSEHYEVDDAIDNSIGLKPLPITKNKPGTVNMIAIDQDIKNRLHKNDIESKAAESLIIDKEKPGQADLNHAVNKVEPSEPEKPEIIQPQQKPVKDSAVPEEEPIKPAIAESEGRRWLMTQPAENYTLQLMVLSKPQSITDLLKKYQLSGKDIRTIKTVSNGKERLIVFYGSFASSTLANKARQSLPPEFQNSYPRKINAMKQ
ncbi:MAG: ATP-binding protein [Methylobacter sp.]|nr:ATP-binding protein [Methylobacter sp.]